MGFWAAVIPALAEIVVDNMSGGGGSGGYFQAASDRADLEGRSLQNQQKYLDELFNMTQSFDPTPVGRLNIPDSKYLDEDFLGGLRPQGDIDLLKFLAGQGNVGASGTLSVAELGARQQFADDQRRQQQGEAISGIIDSLFQLGGNKSGDPGPSATDVYQQQISNVDPRDFGVDPTAYYGYGG